METTVSILDWRPIATAPADLELVSTPVNIMRWCSLADVMDRAGAMWALIGPCRSSRPTGGGGIVSSNHHVPISSDLFQ